MVPRPERRMPDGVFQIIYQESYKKFPDPKHRNFRRQFRMAAWEAIKALNAAGYQLVKEDK